MEKWQAVLCKWSKFSRLTSAGATTLGGWPIMAEQGRALDQRRSWRRPSRLRLAGGGGGKGAALGRLGNTAHPSGGSKRGVLTRRMSTAVMGGRPEGNGGRGGNRGGWSTTHGAERWYTTARCLWRRRGARRGTGVGATRWLDGGGTRRRSGGDGREEERLLVGIGFPL
jgi:hypothetical protein